MTKPQGRKGRGSFPSSVLGASSFVILSSFVIRISSLPRPFGLPASPSLKISFVVLPSASPAASAGPGACPFGQARRPTHPFGDGGAMKGFATACVLAAWVLATGGAAPVRAQEEKEPVQDGKSLGEW